MSRLEASVKLNDREFIIRELTVEEIIKLTNESTLLHGTPEQGNGVEGQKEDGKAQEGEKDSNLNTDKLAEDIATTLKDMVLLTTGLTEDIRRMMDISCNFKIEDLKPLAPSEIKYLVEKFKLVNETFLGVLKGLGLQEVILEVREATLSSFSRTLATSLRAAI